MSYSKKLTKISDSTAIKDMCINFNNMEVSADAFKKTQSGLDDSLYAYFNTLENGEKATYDGYESFMENANSGMVRFAKNSKLAAIGTGLLNAALMACAAFIVTSMITAVIEWADAIHVSREEMKELADESKHNIQDIKDSFESLSDTVDDTKDRYAELAQSVDQMSGKNLTLSDDDYQEFLDISNQLAELSPGLVKGYDLQGNAILDLNGDVQSIVSSLDDLIDRQRALANQDIISEIPNVYNDMVQNLDEYQNKVNELTIKRDGLSKLLQDQDAISLHGNQLQIKTDSLNYEEGVKTFIELQDALENAGIERKSFFDNFMYNPSEQTISLSYTLNGDIDTTLLQDAFESHFNDIQSDLQNYTDDIQTELDSFNKYLYTFFSESEVYNKLDDSNLQTLIQQVLYNSDWMKDAQAAGKDTKQWNMELQHWIEDTYVDGIAKIKDTKYQLQLSDLFSMNVSAEQKIEIAQELQDYFNQNEIAISLKFITDTSDESSVANLVNRMNTVNYESTKGSPADYNLIQNYTSNFTEEEINKWLEVTGTIDGAVEKIKAYKEATSEGTNSNSFLTDDNIDAISAYKTKISDLTGYLDSLKNNQGLTADEASDLITTYGIASDSVDGYREAIVNAMNEEAVSSDIMTSLTTAIEQCTDAEEKSKLQTLYDNLLAVNDEAKNSIDGFNNLSDAISALQSKADLLRNLKDSIDKVGYIDSSNLDDIVSTYPELTDKVAQYNAGLITSSELFNSLTEAYQTDAENYKLAVANKLQYDENFYNSFKENVPQWLNDLASAYGVDLQNYTNLCNAKLEVTKMLAQKQAMLASAQQVSEQLIETASSDGASLRDASQAISAIDDVMDMQQQVDDIQSIIDGMDDIEVQTVDFNTDWHSYGIDLTDDSDSDSDKEDSKTSIDWAEQSLKVLQDDVDNLQDALDNTYGVDNQIAAINDLNTALKKLKQGYQNAADVYDTRYTTALKKLPNNGKDIKKKIESGESFDLTEYDSDTADIIQTAIDAYNDRESAKQQVKTIGQEIKHNKIVEKSKIRQSQYEKDLEVINTLLDSSNLSAEEKNKLLDEQLAKQKQINDELRIQAGYENDQATIDKLNAEDANNERDTKIKQIQQLKDENQNTIDLLQSQMEDQSLTQTQKDSIQQQLDAATDQDYKYQLELALVSDDSLEQFIDDIQTQTNATYKKAKTKLNKFSKSGNVDLTNRPIVSAETMEKAGYDMGDSTYATTMTSGEFIWQGDEKNGKYVYVHYTPILPDGTVLDQDTMATYLHETLEGSKNVLKADTKGLVIKVDTDLNVTDKDIENLLNTGKMSKKMKTFLSEADNWDVLLHDYQAIIYDAMDLDDYSIGSDVLKDIIDKMDDTEVSQAYQDYMNNQQNKAISQYESDKEYKQYYINDNNNDLQDIQNDIEEAGGKGTIAQYKKMQTIYTSNIEYYKEQKALIEEQLKGVTEGTQEWNYWNSELQDCENNLHNCNEEIKNCYISILKLPLNDVEDRLSDIQTILSDLNELIDDQNTYISSAVAILDDNIESQEYLKKIVQDQIDKLQEENELRQANLDVQKAEWDLQKAKNQKTSKMFVEGEGWVYQSNEDDIRNAQEAYDNAIYNKQITVLQQQIDSYDKEIDRLSEIQKKWSRISDDAQDTLDIEKAISYDAEFRNKVLSDDATLLQTIKTTYESILKSQDVYGDQEKDYTKMQDLINDTVEDYENGAISYDQAKQQISDSIRAYYPELANSYLNEQDMVDTLAEKKLEEAGITKETSETNAEYVDESTKKILESYQGLSDDLEEVFNTMTTTMNTFAENAKTMATTVSEAINRARASITGTIGINAANIAVASLATGISSIVSGSKNNTDSTNSAKVAGKIASVGKSHSGMELGYVSKNMGSSGSKDDFQALCLDDLKSDEILRVLRIGESVLNTDQISTLMNNFNTLGSIATSVPVIPLRDTQSTNKTVEFNGDIVLNSVNNVDSLAKNIQQNLPNAMLQELFK